MNRGLAQGKMQRWSGYADQDAATVQRDLSTKPPPQAYGSGQAGRHVPVGDAHGRPG